MYFDFPDISPVIFSIGSLSIRWYAMAYLAGIVAAWCLTKRNINKYNLGISSEQLDDLVFYVTLGIILGGRLGYVCCYGNGYFWQNPKEIFAVWHGGMSFHGGLIGLSASVFLADKKNFWNNLDKAALIAIVVLPIGRIVNFINGELWGTPTAHPWGVVFLGADFQPRHPVQIYEAVFEGPFAALVIYALKNKLSKSGDIACAYGIFYALARFITEFFREPDIPVGYIFTFFSLGQILCFIQLIVISIIFKYKRTRQKAICRKSD